MNFLIGGLKNKITNIYKHETDSNTTDNYNELEALRKENEIYRQIIFENENKNKGVAGGITHVGKFFSEFKSTFITNERTTESNKSVGDFKRFLYDNMLFYNNLEEDDVDYLNSINIYEEDWEKNRELYIFKQKIIERNYREMFKNIQYANELNAYITANTNTSSNNNANTSTIVPNKQSNKYNDLINTNKEALQNALLKDSFTTIDTGKHSKKPSNNIPSAFINNDTDNMAKPNTNTNVNVNAVNELAVNKKTSLKDFISMDDPEEGDLSSVLKPKETVSNPASKVNSTSNTTTKPNANKTVTKEDIAKSLLSSKIVLIKLGLLEEKEETSDFNFSTTKTQIQTQTPIMNTRLSTGNIVTNKVEEKPKKNIWDEDDEEF